MNLKQEINRTEAEKNKTKQVAINIDNKLVELGGEQATDLADVPNKMGAMVKGNYKRFASVSKRVNISYSSGGGTQKINTSFLFKPEIIIIFIKRGDGKYNNNYTVASSTETIASDGLDISVKIKNINKEYFEIEHKMTYGDKSYYVYKIIAIG